MWALRLLLRTLPLDLAAAAAAACTRDRDTVAAKAAAEELVRLYRSREGDALTAVMRASRSEDVKEALLLLTAVGRQLSDAAHHEEGRRPSESNGRSRRAVRGHEKRAVAEVATEGEAAKDTVAQSWQAPPAGYAAKDSGKKSNGETTVGVLGTVRRHLGQYVRARDVRSMFHVRMECTEAWRSHPLLEAEIARVGVALEDLLPNLDIVVIDEHGYPWGPHSEATGLRKFLSFTHRGKPTERLLSPQQAESGWQLGDEGSVDVLCGIAALASIPSEHTRLAFHALALLSPQGHRGALTAACCAASHRDAAVREQALELLLCLVRPRDVKDVQAMLRSQYDAHASRISREVAEAVIGDTCNEEGANISMKDRPAHGRGGGASRC